MPDLFSAFRINGLVNMGDAAANRVVVDRNFRRFVLRFIVMLVGVGEDYLVVMDSSTTWLKQSRPWTLFGRWHTLFLLIGDVIDGPVQLINESSSIGCLQSDFDMRLVDRKDFRDVQLHACAICA